MTTFHVQPDGFPDLRIYSPRLGRTIQFVEGEYKTDDPAEIRVLRRNRFVFDVGELERDLTTPAPPVGADPGLVNVELDKLRTGIARDHDDEGDDQGDE